MRIVKLGSGLVLAACAAGLLAASAMAAPPEWGRCVESPTKTGGYTAAQCGKVQPEHKGAYEWVPEPSAKPGFLGEGEVAYLETTGGRKISCAVADEEGKYTGGKTETTIITLVGCTTKIGTETANCRSNPLKEGEIETGELEGEIGFITVNERKKVGLDLKPKSPSTSFASFTCGPPPPGISTLLVTWEGSVIAPIGPPNRSRLEFKSVYKQVERGVQQVQSFEGGAKDTLSLSFVEGLALPVTEGAAMHMRYIQTNEEAAEINTKA
jgi:hypothetical protein